ncbi:hypothetical protein CASFOL_027512 [Castilleja foliolosa]|uniref:Heparan-alpha-glucosaminide N-acetyltransferase catalytic domain-containing protein n=1 Tax=Castilleja foliolosa TaxID=1961234 RepID=A0ABD3CHJ1_9LAMI
MEDPRLKEGLGSGTSKDDDGRGKNVISHENEQTSVIMSTPRVATLDAFRGLTIVVMILVDHAGWAYPRIDHSPWNGCTLADFVMPFFLFIVGVSIALALKRVPNVKYAVKKIILRTLKLLFWGILLQGGYTRGLDDLSYGVDMKKIRWFGILQNSFGVLCRGLNRNYDNKAQIDKSRTRSFLDIHCLQMAMDRWICCICSLHGHNILSVKCGMRGHLGPACNAVGYVDRQVWGINHLYGKPVFSRLRACTLSSPDSGPFRKNAPNWCRAPFEPEGLLSSISAIISGTIGVHYGHVLIHFKGHGERLKQWVSMALVLLIVAVILHFTDAIPMNKQLYSFSYVCFTAGAAGIVFSGFYILIDVWGMRVPFLFLEWIGMNSMLVFVLAAHKIFTSFIKGWYFEDPDNNLVNWILQHVFSNVSKRVGALLYVIFVEITFWAVVSGILHRLGIYWKL